MVFEENFAGNVIRYKFHYANTYRYMVPYLVRSEQEEYDILATEEYIDRKRSFYPECQDDSYVEYKSLIGLTSRTLLPHRCCLFHAVAFKWNNLAWLLTGQSGAGKTTQYKKWKIIRGNEVQMICGDMPLLAFKEDGSIWVHPSPWNGKERIKGRVAAPLGGVVILEKDNTNSIERMHPVDSAVPLFLQWAVRPETEEQIRLLSDLSDHLLENYPVWKLRNCGDTISARVTASAFEQYINKGTI